MNKKLSFDEVRRIAVRLGALCLGASIPQAPRREMILLGPQ